MSVTIVETGPLFDGRAPGIIQDACDDIGKTVGSLGASMVRSELDHVLRHQTPHYRLMVESKPEAGGAVITDNGVIYGHWLEGTGSRNATTRFKGYFTFRRICQQLDARAQDIANSVIRKYIDRLS
jgi:hypothetical protein